MTAEKTSTNSKQIYLGSGVGRMNRMIHAALLLSVALSLTGCESITGCQRKMRNKCIAHKAWHEWSGCYDDLDYPHHFARGFRAGYIDILEGGKGCQPTMPPKCYWDHCHSPNGLCQTNAWFDGFLHGVLAANQDGVGVFSSIPISPTARMNLDASRTDHPYGNSGEHGPPPIAIPDFGPPGESLDSSPLIDDMDDIDDEEDSGKVGIDEVIDGTDYYDE